MSLYFYNLETKKVKKKMSLFDIFNPEKSKKKLEELKLRLQFNPLYFKEMEALKLNRDLKAYA